MTALTERAYSAQPASLRRLAVRLLRHTFEQKHGARGHFVDSSDVDLTCLQLRGRRVEQPFPALRLVAVRQGELDGLVVRVEHHQQRYVRPPPLDTRRLPTAV